MPSASDGPEGIANDERLKAAERDLRAADGTWKSTLFLVDSGADCSVISFAAANALGPAVVAGRNFSALWAVSRRQL